MELRRYSDRATAGGVGVAHWGQPGGSHRGSGAAGWCVVCAAAGLGAASAAKGPNAGRDRHPSRGRACRRRRQNHRHRPRADSRAEPSEPRRAEPSRLVAAPRRAEPPRRAAEPSRRAAEATTTKPHAQTKPLAHELRRKTQMHDLAAAHEDVLDVMSVSVVRRLRKSGRAEGERRVRSRLRGVPRMRRACAWPKHTLLALLRRSLGRVSGTLQGLLDRHRRTRAPVRVGLDLLEQRA